MNLPDLISLLNNHYLNKFDTKIIGGFTEPFYKAPHNNSFAEIQFSYNYIRSALHELAHWCIAGTKRRMLDDFGYWYAEDGRSQNQQDEFFKVEVKPQSIEWAFSLLLGVSFEASVDNLNTNVDGIEQFKKDLNNQLTCYCNNGFNQRVNAILELFATHQSIKQPIEFILQKSKVGR